MRLDLIALGAAAALSLAGCANVNSPGPDASPGEAAAAAYRHNGPPALTLYTMLNNATGAGAHTSLMINAPSQRVVFDPAGSVRFAGVPEIGDVLYGITPQIKQFYESAHARSTYHVRIQRIEVSPEIAEMALRLAVNNGAVAPAQCTSSTSAILRKLPGFQSLGSTWFPRNLAEDFARLPGVTERKLFEDDADDKSIAIAEFEQQIGAPAQ